MNYTDHRNWDIGQRLVIALACPILMLLLNAVCSAQMVTATPTTIADPAKPPLVKLTIQTNANAPDTATTDRVGRVKVGGTQVDVQKDVPKGEITFTPPPNLSGAQQAQLLDGTGNPLRDSAGNPLGQIQLTYPSGGGSNASSSPTTDLARYRADNEIKRQNDVVSKDWYYPLIIIGFALVLGAFAFTIVKGILFSRATFRSPLGLPVGSFRAILAYTLVAYLGFYVLVSLLTVSTFAPPDFLLGIIATVVGFYFGSRTGEEGTVDERAGIVRGVVRRDTPGSGAPVSGALVKFKRDADGTEPYSRLTDVDGRFVLQGVKPGKYKVSATLTGSGTPGQVDINITEGSDQEIEIVIKGVATTGTGGTTGRQGSGTGTGSGTGGSGTGSGTPPAGVTVKGKVVQSDGTTPIAGANVVLSQGGAEKGKATSGQDGSYTIDKKVEAGKYKIVASATGFADATLENVDVKAGQEAAVPDLKLNRA
jgi:hypothetical protein